MGGSGDEFDQARIGGRPVGDEEVDLDALFASLDEAAEALAVEKDEALADEEGWVPPHVVDVELPIDASIALDELVASLEQFADSAQSFLQDDHLDIAGIAQQLAPVGSPDDFAATEEQLAAWGATVDGRTRGLVDLMALVEDDRRLVRDYAERVGEVFAGAPPPPEPPPPPPPPDEEGGEPDEPAMTPV
jgi:hypothetical protein